MSEVLPSWFPHPRYNRQQTGSLGLAGLSGVGMPTTRLWPFHIREAGLVSAAVVVSPRFRGPAVIRRIQAYTTSVGGGNPMAGMQLFISQDNSGAGVNLASAVVVPGEKLWDTLSLQDDQGGVTAPGDMGPTFNSSVAQYTTSWEIGKAVWSTDFYLRLKIMQNAAGAMILEGWVTLLEGVDPLEVARYL